MALSLATAMNESVNPLFSGQRDFKIVPDELPNLTKL